jgi:hypothetical protein
LHLLLPLTHLLLQLGPGAIDDLLGLDGGVLQAGLRVPLGLLENAPAVLRNVSQLTGGDLPLVEKPSDDSEGQQDEDGDDQDEQRREFQLRHLPSGVGRPAGAAPTRGQITIATKPP